MKLHLPITLLTAVLATSIALPAQAVEAPEGYTTTYLNSPGTLETYSELTAEEYIAFILQSSQEFTPTGADYWTSSTPLVSGGNVFFGSYNSDFPVALSFKDVNGSAFSGQSALTFDTLSNLTFSTITDNDPAISLANNGTLTITNVNDGQSDTVDVLFNDIEHTTSDTDSYGGAIYADNGDVTISNNGDVSFSGNSSSSDYDGYYASYSYGGAIYADDGDVTISHNGNVSFSRNSLTGYYTRGGAIYASTVTISNNGNVSFSDNSSSSSSYSSGGAIYAYDGDVTISNNGDVSFSGNSASAIYADYADVTISNNGTVSFSGNHAGAIYTWGDVAICNNGDVSFSGNYASVGGAIYDSHADVTISNNGAVSFSGNYADDGGGAIYAYAYEDDVTISNNDAVSFSGNYASRPTGSSYGGAIYAFAGGVTINNNGDVSFSGNYASGDYAFGGAIYAHAYAYAYADGDLYIQGNDSVLFEKNYEKSADSYRLRSIYAEDGSSMNLSAKTGGHITFYDSVYTTSDAYFNSDYEVADGDIQSAKGDIIFSGKYAEEHLNEILAANNEGRTAKAEEILNSQTSTIEGNAYLNGGSLQIKDGAVFNVNGDTVNIAAGSNATLAISDAELVAANATIEVGESATLQLSNGAVVTADEINIAAGATLAIGDIAVTTSEIDSMVAAYRISSLNVINGDLTFAAGSTLVTDGIGISMTEGSVLTFNATSEGEKINLVFTLGTEYNEDGLVQLFSNVDIVKFLMDGEEVDTSTTLLASDFFTGAGINESTTLNYDSTANVVYLEGVNKVVPEPTTATLSLLALAALAARRRRR